jgi:hypothetical protein
MADLTPGPAHAAAHLRPPSRFGARGWHYALVVAGVIALQASALLATGRVPWCTCGYVKLWHGTVQNTQNSQHLTDWYSFTHLVHGFGFYLLLWLVARQRPLGLRLALATGLEAAWEVLENTNFVIDRYREATIALDYYGDSIINSVGDTLARVLGFILASRLPVWATVTLAIALELVLAHVIRDNLTLKILMLIYPFRAIKQWQQGA